MVIRLAESWCDDDHHVSIAYLRIMSARFEAIKSAFAAVDVVKQSGEAGGVIVDSGSGGVGGGSVGTGPQETGGSGNGGVTTGENCVDYSSSVGVDTKIEQNDDEESIYDTKPICWSNETADCLNDEDTKSSSLPPPLLGLVDETSSGIRHQQSVRNSGETGATTTTTAYPEFKYSSMAVRVGDEDHSRYLESCKVIYNFAQLVNFLTDVMCASRVVGDQIVANLKVTHTHTYTHVLI